MEIDGSTLVLWAVAAASSIRMNWIGRQLKKIDAANHDEHASTHTLMASEAADETKQAALAKAIRDSDQRLEHARRLHRETLQVAGAAIAALLTAMLLR